MKGAIGNALILNIVITFIFIFFILLIGSMAYSKAYKTKNYLINMIDQYDGKREGFNWFVFKGTSQSEKWEKETGEYLLKTGYQINQGGQTCPKKPNYELVRDNAKGYDYCIYINIDTEASDNNTTIYERYNYMVLVYMKFDFPLIGNHIKLHITGETKSYTVLR